jgi:hypothetical protein
MYPEHDKLKKHKEDAQIISEFCEFLQGRGMIDASDKEIESWMFEFFGIDEKQFKAEKRLIFAAAREAA